MKYRPKKEQKPPESDKQPKVDHSGFLLDLMETLDRLENHTDSIYVRMPDGTNLALSEMTTEQAVGYVCWCLRGRILRESIKHVANEIGAGTVDEMKKAQMAVGYIEEHTNPQQCLEIGAALLLDKPLFLVVSPNAFVPPKLAKLADAVIQGELNNETRDRLYDAMEKVMTARQKQEPKA